MDKYDQIIARLQDIENRQAATAWQIAKIVARESAKQAIADCKSEGRLPIEERIARLETMLQKALEIWTKR